MSGCPRGCCATYREHLEGVVINTRVASPMRKQERNESKDMDAYARLRRNGVQPKTIEGAAELERGASTVHEIENKNIITDPQLRRRVTNAFESAKDFTTTPIGGGSAA